ncbi:MAG: fibrobacter succinogenes major paralogous domain-containing protein [Lentimicrobiaceae bacterium]|nr:fibrobacter succinogenes major paralogous domain-containing protein [Lentimicrobiaceae bacterium]
MKRLALFTLVTVFLTFTVIQISCKKDDNDDDIPGSGMPTITDYNCNIYNTVKIGTQYWMKENLKVRNYRNGTAIPNITDNSIWGGLSTGARCWYNNDSATFAATYGAFYNWHAVDDTNGLCPTGWHVPTDPEWQTLEMFLGMSLLQASLIGLRGTDEGGKMKEAGLAHWFSLNACATNVSGFTALPGGRREYGSGYFNYLGSYGSWWSSSDYSPTIAWFRDLSSNYSIVDRYHVNKKYGCSVRCVRD